MRKVYMREKRVDPKAPQAAWKAFFARQEHDEARSAIDKRDTAWFVGKTVTTLPNSLSLQKLVDALSNDECWKSHVTVRHLKPENRCLTSLAGIGYTCFAL